MRFLLDESADSRLESYLAARDHVVLRLARDFRAGLPDIEVLQIAFQEKCILITNDRDFGELIFRRRLPHVGVVFFRLQSVDLANLQFWLGRVLSDYVNQLDQFIVVTERGIRVRGT